jgi:hypothetical protein
VDNAKVNLRAVGKIRGVSWESTVIVKMLVVSKLPMNMKDHLHYDSCSED